MAEDVYKHVAPGNRYKHEVDSRYEEDCIERMALNHMETVPPYLGSRTSPDAQVFPFRVAFRYMDRDQWRKSCRGADVRAQTAANLIGDGSEEAALRWLKAGRKR
jgi:hypothetical protein